MKDNDNLYLVKVFANKTYDNGISRDYTLMMNIYAINPEDVMNKLEDFISSKSVRFEVTHKLINFELSEPLAPRSSNL